MFNEWMSEQSNQKEINECCIVWRKVFLGCDIQARERAFQIKRPTQAQTLRQQRACFLGFFAFLINNLFYSWLHWVFVAAHGLSLIVAGRGYSSLRFAGFSLQWLPCCRSQARGAWTSVAVAHRPSSCGTWAQLLWGIWNLPRRWMEPMSPALAGRFLSIALPG